MTQLTLLVLQESPTDSSILRELPSWQLDLRVRPVSSAAEFKRALSLPFHVALLNEQDFPLPPEELIVKCCELETRPRIVVLSADCQPERGQTLIELGADEYIPQNDLGRLRLTLIRIIRQIRSEAELVDKREKIERLDAQKEYVLANVLDIVTVLDIKGTIIYESESLLRVLGWRPEELVGVNVFAYIHPVDVPRVMSIFMLGVATPDSVHSVRFRFRHKEGGWRSLESLGVCKWTSDGLRIIVSSRDTTRKGKNQASLGESESRFWSVVEGLAEGVVIFDLNNSVHYVNQPVSGLTGFDAADLLGTPIDSLLIASDDHQRFFERTRDLSKNVQLEVRVCRKDGSVFWSQINASPYRDQDAEIIGTICAITDITERKLAEERLREANEELEERVRLRTTDLQHANEMLQTENLIRRQSEEALRESEERFHSLAEAMPQIVWISEPSGELIYLNKQALDYIGSAVNIHKLNGWAEAIHTEDVRAYKEQWKNALRFTSTYEIEYRLRRASDGSFRWHMVRAVPILNDEGETIHWFGTCTDIHDRKLAEQELKQSHVMLEERVRERTKDLQQTNILLEQEITDRKEIELALRAEKERAEEMNRLKTSFLANMSHEIRTPMTSILGFASHLTEELETTELGQYSKLIEKSGRRLMNTINGILDLAKIESNKLELELQSLVLEDEVWRSVELLLPQAEQKGIALTFESKLPGIWVQVDPHYLGQVLTNIVGNAIKFTEKGSVGVAIEMESSTEIAVHVKDSGVGISGEFLPHIFDEFKQESVGWSRHFEGTGLGLTISKKLMDMLGGTIRVSSKRGEGTEFTLVFPALTRSEDIAFIRPQIAGKVSVLPAKISTDDCSILLVEDNSEMAALIRHYLEGLCTINHVTHRDFEKQLLKEKNYALTLMDINFGIHQKSLEVTKELRKDPEFAALPIVAITAYPSLSEREEARECGYTGYIPNPFSREQLRSTVQQFLTVRKKK